eukprot:symbB.v1.2.030887.t1/scaffold3525.1/size55316/5
MALRSQEDSAEGSTQGLPWKKSKVSVTRTHHIIVDEAGNLQPLYNKSFDEVLPFHEPGLAPVRRGGLAWHIQADGSNAYSRTFARTFGFYQGRASVKTEDGTYHHIVSSGEDLYPERFEWCGNYQGGFCPVRSDGHYFHLDWAGRPAYDERWNYVGDYREGSAVVHKDGKATHIDHTGSLLHGSWFLDLDVFHKGFARAKDSEGWMHINEQGQAMYQHRFQTVEPFYNGQARVQSWDGSWQVINEVAETLVQIDAPEGTDVFGKVSADLVGFWKTQTLCAAVEMGVFEAPPGTLEALAATLQLRPDRLKRLLRALMEVQYVKIDKFGQFVSTERGQLLQEGHPLTLRDAALEYGRELDDLWSELPRRLREDDRSPEIFQKVATSPDRCERHHRMLQSYARHDYLEVPKLPLLEDSSAVVLDVGSGSGTLGKLFAQEYPQAKIFLLDLPEVLQQVTEADGRLHSVFVDLQSDWSQEVPLADLVLLGRVLHDFYDDAAVKILETAHKALKPDGRIAIIEFLLPDVGAIHGGLCDLHLLTAGDGSLFACLCSPKSKAVAVAVSSTFAAQA